MLHQEKVRLMTRMSIFEESEEGKKSFQLSKYYKRDYIRWELIKTILSVTLGYVLILVMAGLYFFEYLIANAVSLDYVNLGMKLLGCYLILLVVYFSAGWIMYSCRYNREHKGLVRYYKSLKHLMRFYGQKENEIDKQEE